MFRCEKLWGILSLSLSLSENTGLCDATTSCLLGKTTLADSLTTSVQEKLQGTIFIIELACPNGLSHCVFQEVRRSLWLLVGSCVLHFVMASMYHIVKDHVRSEKKARNEHTAYCPVLGILKLKYDVNTFVSLVLNKTNRQESSRIKSS